MNAPGDRFILHPSVAALWWLRHRTASDVATRFLLEALRFGRVRVAAVDDLEWQTLQLLAQDLGESHLVGTIAAILYDDVTALFRVLRDGGIARLEDRQPLLREAFVLATFYAIALPDAVSAALADRTGIPLLVADANVAEVYRGMVQDRASLRVMTLTEYFGH